MGVNLWEILFMIKRLYIILGRSNSHKSSVMRCLTGSAITRGNWQMQFLNNETKTSLVSITSPQERNRNGLSVQQFLDEIINAKEEIILITLQSISTTQQPNGEVYLQAFIDAGFDIQVIACFDRNANTLNLPFQLYNTTNVPSNQTASEVRKLWGLI